VRLGHSTASDGWLDDQALIADFDLNRLGRAAAKFDDAQLRHWQKETVAHLSTEEFVKWIAAELPPGLDDQQRTQFVNVVRGNVELPSDARAWAKVVFGKLDEFEPTALTAIREAGEAYFTEALKVIGQPGAEFKQAVKALGQSTGKKGPALFMPLRAALTGFTHGPELAPMLALLPVAEIQARLEHAGYRVNFVRNITDIDDKIIKRAAENGESIKSLTDRFTRYMHEDYDRLGILPPTHEPKATEHIAGIIGMTQELIDKGFAYVASNGDVLYSVSKFDGYGKLSGRSLEDMRAGARVAVDEAKHDPADFVLWKRAKPGEPFWPSPWGDGRPGWHIECSAMSLDLLGSHFDIHGGGMDLKFPHHENEIAQSCAATGDTFASVWMHNGFVNVDDEKMSKSLGNFFRIRDVLDSGHIRDPEVLRFFLVSSQYRGPINYSLVQIEQADAALGRLYTALREVTPASSWVSSDATRRFEAAMDDDFNTPDAIAALQTLATDLNRAKSAGDTATASALAAELKKLGGVLGLLQLAPEEFLRKGAAASGLSDADIESLIAARKAARTAKNFKEADRVRQQLSDAGVILEDKPDGTTTWRRS
jgi:cysteinyl-tRNA synthetase